MSPLNSQIDPTIPLQDKEGEIASSVVDQQYLARPDLLVKFGERGRARCLEDVRYHLSYLIQSLRASSPELFIDYIVWARAMLSARQIPAEDLAQNLAFLLGALRQMLPPEVSEPACACVDAALAHLPNVQAPTPRPLDSDAPFHDLAAEYLAVLLRGERHIASRLILDAVQGGTRVQDIYLHVFQRTQREVGRLWQVNAISVAEEHYCSAATQLIMSQLYPYVFGTERNGRTLVAACVAGDLHEIGLRIVTDFFEMDGWDTYYLGANVPTSSVVTAVEDRAADVLAVSATMGFHVGYVADLITAVRRSDVGKHVKVLVGGRPFSIVPNLWQRVGADLVATDAEEAVGAVTHLLQP